MVHRSLTPARQAANRRNAQQSTGPRTAAGKARSRLNALRHGAYRQPRPAVLEELGENSEEYQRLLAETLDSLPPANTFENELIRDIARLRWERRRLERAKDAKVRTRLEAQENEWQRRLVEMEHEYSTAAPEQTLAFGLRRLKDSVGKFRRLLKLLETLESLVDLGDFSTDATELFRQLWGVKPAVRGVEIISRFSHFAERGGLQYIRPFAVIEAMAASAAAGGEEDAAKAPGQAVEASPPGPEEENSRREEAIAYRALRMAVQEEKRDVIVEHDLFKKEQVPASRAALDACLAPTEDGEWRLLIRWENTIDRQIERKMNLYLRLRGLAFGALAGGQIRAPAMPPEGGD